MIDKGLTIEEHGMFLEMKELWGKLLGRNRELMRHLEGKVPVRDLGISIPPPMARRLRRCSVMWSKQAVHRVSDASVIREWAFPEGAPAGFSEMLEANEVEMQYDEVLPSQLAHGPSFWTVTGGGKGEPAAVVASYDAEHACALYDYRHRRVLCGMTIVDVDRHEPSKPTAVNFFAPDGSVVEMELNGRGQWMSRRRNYDTGRCMMEVLRNEPTRLKPFGTSVITPAIMSLEDEANREAVRMAMQSEIFTAPTRWVMGADDNIFDNGRWEAYLGSIFALPVNEEGEAPKTGQYAQGDMTPHVAYVRQLANMFAAEASIPVHSLLYTEANPASAEAIAASRNDLVERVERLNRLNARGLRNIGLMALSVIEERPVSRLGANELGLHVEFKNPQRATLAASADAAQKISAQVPGFTRTKAYWTMQGFGDAEAEDILADLDRMDGSGAIAALADAMGGDHGE